MLAYLTGYSMLYPVQTSLMVTVFLVFIVGIFNMTWFLYLRNKMLKIFSACLGISDTLGMGEEELFLRAAKRAKGGG